MAQKKKPAEATAHAEEVQAAEQPDQQPAGNERLAQLEAQLSELEKALAAKEEQLATREKEAGEYLEGWQRERAQFENYRKRVTREMDEAGIVAKVDLIRSILPAIDDMERALEDASTDVEVLRKGVRMTHDQLLAGLAKHGLVVVPAAGEPFDPNVHEAVGVVEDSECAPDTVVDDLQKGYILGERLVRPARVRVAH